MKDAPVCITKADALKKLWESWKIAGKPPEIDLAKNLVVVVPEHRPPIPRSPPARPPTVDRWNTW